MKLHATISMLSTMLLMGLQGATSPSSCRDKAHVDTMSTGVLWMIFKKECNKNCERVRGRSDLRSF